MKINFVDYKEKNYLGLQIKLPFKEIEVRSTKVLLEIFYMNINIGALKEKKKATNRANYTYGVGISELFLYSPWSR